VVALENSSKIGFVFEFYMKLTLTPFFCLFYE
jgi:hypothetical protein